MAKPGRPGASKGNKKGPTKGTGGKNKRSLEGRGPTPKAEDRAWHPAGKRKAAAAVKRQLRRSSRDVTKRQRLY